MILGGSVRIAVKAAALFVVAVGALVLAGWLLGIPALMRIVPGAVAMVPGTAVGFLLSGMALWLRAGERSVWRLRVSGAAAAGAGLLGLMNLVEYFSGRDLGIDELLFRDPAGLTGAMPGRMAAATALSFVAFAAASLLPERREASWVVDTLALVPGLLGLVSLTGYIYGMPGFYWVGSYKGMAIHTAVGFIGLTTGALFARPTGGVSRLVLSDTVGGEVARRMLPVVLGAPLLLAGLGLLGQKTGVLGPEFEDALIAVASVVILLAVLVMVAERLRRADEEKRNAQGTLEKSEQRFRALFERAGDAIFVVGEDGRIRDANLAAEAGYGFSREALVGRHVADFRPEEQRRTARANLEAAKQRGHLVFEGEHLRADGSRFPVEVSARRVDLQQEVVHFSVVRDITIQKRAEARIRQLNRLLRTVSEISQAIVRTDDRETLLSEACRVLVEHGGFRMAWIGIFDPATSRVVPAARAGEGAEYLDGIVVRSDDSPEGKGPVGTAIRTGRHVVIGDLAADPVRSPWLERQLAYGFRSGGAFPLRVRGEVVGALKIYSAELLAIGEEETALLDELAGDLGFALEALDDRAERRWVEEALRESEERFRGLYENSLLGLYRTTPDGTILMANPSLCRMLGYDSFEELKRRNLEGEGFEPSYPRTEFRRKLEEEGAVMGLESRWKRRNGSVLFVRESAIANRDRAGKVLYYEGTVEDITERKRAEEELAGVQQQLLQAQKMEAIGRLAGGVAHDFNNLLTVIQGYGEMLSTSLAADEVRREEVAEILKAAERAATLTRQLLAFGRRQVLEMQLLDLGAVVSDTEKMLRRLIGEDVELVVQKPGGTSLVKADPGQIEQVLLNLAVNSRDAMPEGGRLTIELAEQYLAAPLPMADSAIPAGSYVVLTATDTGSGMNAETLTHIFEPFFTTKEKGKGTGLGLATVYGIVKQSGGYVLVASEPGRGTTFRVFLPRADGKPPAKPEAPANGTGGTETILLVEDEPGVRELAHRLLEVRGYRVLAAVSSAEALELADRHEGPIHLLVTDLVMPGMNGHRLAETLTLRRPGTRVLFISGYSSGLLSREGLRKGGLHFLQKPFTEVALARSVRKALTGQPPGEAPRLS